MKLTKYATLLLFLVIHLAQAGTAGSLKLCEALVLPSTIDTAPDLKTALGKACVDPAMLICKPDNYVKSKTLAINCCALDPTHCAI